MCLPGLTEADADAVVGYRTNASSTNTSGVGWLFTALSTSKAIGVLNNVTSRSYFYSADIVAVSGDGRAFKRVRIVVDSQTIPAKIVYRKDLTSLGWPLPAEIQTSMRSGKGPVLGLYASPAPEALDGLTGGSL